MARSSGHRKIKRCCLSTTSLAARLRRNKSAAEVLRGRVCRIVGLSIRWLARLKRGERLLDRAMGKGFLVVYSPRSQLVPFDGPCLLLALKLFENERHGIPAHADDPLVWFEHHHLRRAREKARLLFPFVGAAAEELADCLRSNARIERWRRHAFSSFLGRTPWPRLQSGLEQPPFPTL